MAEVMSCTSVVVALGLRLMRQLSPKEVVLDEAMTGDADRGEARGEWCVLLCWLGLN